MLVLLTSFSSSVLADEASAFENSLKAFQTDGCTLFVDGTAKKPELWRHCCVEHDMRYWFGGSKKDMDQTDLRLRECVKDVAGPAWAELIYMGVRTGHYSPIKNKSKWSWGWTIQREKTPLTSIESDYAISEIRRLPFDPDMLEEFIQRNFKNHVE